MIFTPDGIKKQEFKKSFRGFDKEEVHAFLEKLSTEFETVFVENETIKKELEETKQQLERCLQIENKIQQTVRESEARSGRAIEKAQKKAEEILRLAEDKSTVLLQKSQKEADRLKSAVINLREEKEILMTKLKTIINYQAHLLEMKVEDAGEDTMEIKRPEPSSSVGIDVNDIVEKLL
jgi:cell division initiation protein